MLRRASFYYLGCVALFWLAPINQAMAGDILGDWVCTSNQVNEERHAHMQGDFSFGNNGFLNADMDITFVFDDLKVEATAKYLSNWKLEGNLMFETPIRVWIKKYDINGVFARNSMSADELHWSLMKKSDVPSTITFSSDNEMLMEHTGLIVHCER